MDGRSRVRAALRLERVDRPPAAWWGHTYTEEWSPRRLADATIARQRAHGWDFVKLQPRASCFAEAFGASYRPSDDPGRGPVASGPAVREAEDWSRLPAVDATAPPLADQVEALRLVVEGVGPDVPVIQTVFSPLTVAGYLLGEDKPAAARALTDDPVRVGGALGRIAEALGDFAARSVEAGAAGIFFAVSGYASADLVPLEAYGDLALPHDRRVFDAVPAGTWFDVLHLCDARIHLDLASAFDVDALSWSVHAEGNPSLAEVREWTGRAVMGGIDQERTLVTGSPNDVAGLARRAIEETGGEGLLLAPGCSAPVTAPEPNLLAITEGR